MITMALEFGEKLQPISLKELLVGAVRRPNYSLPSGIKEIELGNFARECDSLVR